MKFINRDHTKTCVSFRRELNFNDFAKNMKKWKKSKIVLSCRRERWDSEKVRFSTQPGKAKIELSRRRELDFAILTKKYKKAFPSKSPTPRSRFLNTFWGRFWIHFGVQNRPKIDHLFWVAFPGKSSGSGFSLSGETFRSPYSRWVLTWVGGFICW